MRVAFSIFGDGTPKGCHAFPAQGELLFLLSSPDIKAERAWLYIGNDDKVLLEREVPVSPCGNGFSCSAKIEKDSFSGGKDGLFFCHFEVECQGRRFYTAFDNGASRLEDRFVNEEQFLLYDEKYSSPEWLGRGAIYQIFPDRFARGGKTARRSDAVYNDDWEHGIPEYPDRVGDSFPNNTHFGGSLCGVCEHIGYLKKLGISCIYLNPVFDAYSNHKYDTGDFLTVDKTFGGEKALSQLIEKAHSTGIRVILDGVFNHVGDDSIYFNRYGKYPCTGAYQSKSSPYFGWFHFSEYPDVYDCWWGIRNLPRVVKNASYTRFITETVIPKYMSLGIDGWRLDVADELESGFLDAVCAAIKKCRSDALIIGEVWEDASDKVAYDERKRYFRGSQLDSVTNYPFRNAVIGFCRDGDESLLVDTVNTLFRHYPPVKLGQCMNFLGSHDTERIITVLGGEEDSGEENSVLAKRRMSMDERAKAVEKLKNAYLLLAFLPGVPCIYYGDEIGMEGYHDPFNRFPFPESGFSDPLSGFFAEVNKKRIEEPLFSAVETEIISEMPGTVRITRKKDGESLVMLANMSQNVYESELLSRAIDIFDGGAYNNKVSVCAGKVMILKTE